MMIYNWQESLDMSGKQTAMYWAYNAVLQTA